jgi:hypothetical protein
MTNLTGKNPAVMAQPGSGFRFPPRHPFSSDLETSELRIVIMGWLKQASDVAAANGGLQELRDAIFRAAELTIALSAREIAKEQERREVIQKFKDAPNATTSGKARRRKASAPN